MCMCLYCKHIHIHVHMCILQAYAHTRVCNWNNRHIHIHKYIYAYVATKRSPVLQLELFSEGIQLLSLLNEVHAYTSYTPRRRSDGMRVCLALIIYHTCGCVNTSAYVCISMCMYVCSVCMVCASVLSWLHIIRVGVWIHQHMYE